MFLNSISYFSFSPGVHHFLWDDSCYAERNGFRCPLFVVPSYSWWTPVFLLHVAHCCVHYPMPHSSVYFYQEIEDHQLKNDNQKNKKVLHWGHFVENFSITGHKKQVLYFPLNRLNPYDLYVAVVFVFHQLFSFWFSSPIIGGNSDKQTC